MFEMSADIMESDANWKFFYNFMKFICYLKLIYDNFLNYFSARSLLTETLKLYKRHHLITFQ